MAAPAIRQTSSVVNYSGNPLTMTLPSVTAGSTLIAVTFQYAAATRTYTTTDDSGNRWFQAVLNGSTRTYQIDVAYNAVGSASTVTFSNTISSTGTTRYCVVVELEPCRLVGVTKFDNTDGDNTHYCAPSGEISTLQGDVRLFALTGCTADSGCTLTGSWVSQALLYSTAGSRLITLDSSTAFAGERGEWTGTNNRNSYPVMIALSAESNAPTKTIRLPDGEHASGGARPTIYYGPMQSYTCAQTNRTLNSASYKVSTYFVAPTSDTLASAWVYTNAVWGTVAGIGTLSLQAADADGVPTGSVLESKTFTPAAASWIATTGWTYALTAGSAYCLSVSNNDAAPATNYFSTAHGDNAIGSILTTGRWADGAVFTSRYYNGSTWAGAMAGSSGIFAQVAGGMYIGWPYGVAAGSNDTASDIYGPRGCVYAITMPGHAGLEYRIVGVRAGVAANGSPGDLRIRLYPYVARPVLGNGNVPQAGGIPCLNGSVWSPGTGAQSGAASERDLAVPVWVRGGSLVYVELTSPNSISNANCLNPTRIVGIPTSAVSMEDQLAILGVAGYKATYYAIGAATDMIGTSPTYWPHCSLLIDNMRTVRARSRQTWQ